MSIWLRTMGHRKMHLDLDGFGSSYIHGEELSISVGQLDQEEWNAQFGCAVPKELEPCWELEEWSTPQLEEENKDPSPLIKLPTLLSCLYLHSKSPVLPAGVGTFGPVEFYLDSSEIGLGAIKAQVVVSPLLSHRSKRWLLCYGLRPDPGDHMPYLLKLLQLYTEVKNTYRKMRDWMGTK
jgi:hypothetical protein